MVIIGDRLLKTKKQNNCFDCPGYLPLIRQYTLQTIAILCNIKTINLHYST